MRSEFEGQLHQWQLNPHSLNSSLGDFNSKFTGLEKGVWVSVKVMFINEKSWLDWVCRVINVLGASMNVQEFNAYEDFCQL